MTVGFVRGAALGVAALPIPCCGLFVLLAAVGVAAAAPVASCCGNCPSCLWRARKDARVRREVRDLSGAEWRRVTTVMNTMKRVATTEGQASYGAVYRTYDYFTAKHYAACIDARGNGAHYGPQFATWHAALGLEFERALLAVDPAIEALPYWDASKTSPSVFGRTYFGSAPGDGEDHDVVDGPFGSWRVPQHKALADYAPATSSFAASTAIAGNAAGYLRHPDSMTSVSGVVRFGGDYALDKDAFWRCVDESATFLEWHKCVDLGFAPDGSDLGDSTHRGAHGGVGGFWDSGTGISDGDFDDIFAGTNDPIFFFHHANVERSRHWWSATRAHDAVDYYAYPLLDPDATVGTDAFTGRRAPGQLLNNTLSDGWGFSLDDLGFEPRAGETPTTLVTNARLLCELAPGAAPYAYQDLVQCRESSGHACAVAEPAARCPMLGPSFGEHHTVDGRFDAVAVVDVDADGDQDVVTAEGDWLRIHENVAGRLIARDVVTTKYASPVALDAGEEYIVVGYAVGAVTVHALDGEWIMTVDMDVASGAVVVRAADVDGDGVLDVVSASAEDDTVAVYRASNDFQKRLAASDAVGVTDVGVLDVDGDGDLDLLPTLPCSDAVVALESMPRSREDDIWVGDDWLEYQRIVLRTRGRGQRALAVVGDDVVVAYRTIYVHGEGGKRADAEVSTVDGDVVYDTTDLRWDSLLGADLNGLGAADVVARGNDAFERDNQAGLYWFDAAGLVVRRRKVYTGAVLAFATGDINGDGAVDLVVAPAAGGLAVLVNGGGSGADAAESVDSFGAGGRGGEVIDDAGVVGAGAAAVVVLAAGAAFAHRRRRRPTLVVNPSKAAPGAASESA